MISTVPPVSTVPTGWDHGEHHRKPKLPIAVPDGQAILHAHLAQTALDDERYRQRLAINYHQMAATLHPSLAAQKKVQADLASLAESSGLPAPTPLSNLTSARKSLDRNLDHLDDTAHQRS